MRQIYFDIDFVDCIKYLEDEFFDNDSGCLDYRIKDDWGGYRAVLSCLVVPQRPLTILDKIFIEREYRINRSKIIPKNENEKKYIEATLQISQEEEKRLLDRFERQNNAVGDVDKAKSYPIENIILFTHNFAKCLWHGDGNERTPSLHLMKKANKAYCFSCGRAYDSIDAIRKIYNCSFKEAIKKIS